MPLNTTNNRRNGPKERLFFRRTLKGVYLDFLFTGIGFTMLNVIWRFARLHAIPGTVLAISPIAFLGILMLGVSIIVYCCNYYILVKEKWIKAKLITFMAGFLMNVAIFVLNLFLWIFIK